jgi:hypothetical protein
MADAKPGGAVNVRLVAPVPQTSAQVVELPEHSVVHEDENTSANSLAATLPIASTQHRRTA